MPRVAVKKEPVKAKPRQKKANGYKFPEKLPKGEVLKDTAKKEWILGSSIGQGGFGEIYCASAADVKSSNDPYVIKIEPHENGPLFVEKNFYIKIARPDDVEKWKKEKNIKILGIPTFHGSGSHEYKGEKYRFIVIERYGDDLWSLFLKNKRKFPPAVVYKCAIQIIDVLQYIHEKGYVHGDIKGANLLLGLRKGTENNVFLVDFGLACKYKVDNEFKIDPKKAHNGTIEYTCRDWHMGVPTRRGDMEILGFNLLHWLCSTLPWEGDIKNPEKVFEKKRALMENVKEHMKTKFPDVPKVIAQYLSYVGSLNHDETPDYEFCKEMFIKELKTLPGSTNGKLDFNSESGSKTNSTPKNIKRKSRVSIVHKEELEESDSDNDLFVTPSPKKYKGKTKKNTPIPIPEEIPVEKSTPKKRTRKDAAPKPSWRDAPTAQGSNISKAGEYVKKR
uniref:non-specific serine/threonine protein kinase n=1 Tax=Riptortus pedestris TaxID=329032 RepID=R4WJ35_RIPPE|nr:serine/threonine-protein kinase vrk [Riptortus pedestris]